MIKADKSNSLARVEIVRKCEDAVKAQAKLRQLSGLTNQESLVSVNLRTRGRASNELGEMAGVSASTYEHATAVLDKAPEPVVEATQFGGGGKIITTAKRIP